MKVMVTVRVGVDNDRVSSEPLIFSKIVALEVLSWDSHELQILFFACQL